MFIRKAKLTDPRRSLGNQKITKPDQLMVALNKMWMCLDEIYDFLEELNAELGVRFNEVPMSDMKAREQRIQRDSQNKVEDPKIRELEDQIRILRDNVMTVAESVNASLKKR